MHLKLFVLKEEEGLAGWPEATRGPARAAAATRGDTARWGQRVHPTSLQTPNSAGQMG